MPLPQPGATETREAFVARCMKDPATQDITGANADEAQQRRLAACFRQWEGGKMAEGDFETKGFGALEIKNVDQGEVVAVVATLGVVDKDGDVILPGAIPPNSQVKMSAYGHDVILDGAVPVGKGTISEEAGQAVFRGKFFLTTQRGRESFNTVKELGADSEWSFGFPRRVQTAELSDEWKTKGARRVISGMVPIEASPVFVGAGIGTRTVMAKAADTGENEKTEPTASVDGVEHEAEDFAYVPDATKPSTWKFPIFDAIHVRNALARFDQANLPESDKAAVLARIHEAAKKFEIDIAAEKKAAEDVELAATRLADAEAQVRVANEEADRYFAKFRRHQ